MDSWTLGQLLIKFLLIPESFLSVFFVMILFWTYYWGYRQIVQVRYSLQEIVDRAELEYGKLTGLYNPFEYAKVLFKSLEETEYAVSSVPNWLVSIGILATFLGLGVALKEAADLVQGSGGVDVGKLNGVLSLIAFKFQTSVWGLTLSLLFQRLGLSAYVSFRQEAEQVLLEKLYRMKEVGLEDKLDQQTELLTNLVHHAGQNAQTVRSLQEAIQSFSQGTAQTLTSLSTNMEKMMDSQLMRLDKMNSQALLLQEKSSQSLEKSLVSISQTIAQELENLQHHLGQVQEAANEVTAQQVQKMEQSFLTGLNKMTESVAEFNERSLTLQTSSSQRMADMAEASERLEAGIQEGLDSIAKQLVTLSEYVNDFDSTNQVVLKTIAQLKDEIRRVTDVFERMSALESEQELAVEDENSAVRLFINPFDALRGQNKEGS